MRILIALATFGIASVATAGDPWTMHIIDDSSRGADGVRMADVNGDGYLDIATGWEEGGVVRMYLNPGPRRARQSWPGVTVGGHTTGNSWWAQFKKGHRFLVINVKEALEQPGEWYLDRPSGRLTYVPRPGETPETAAVVVPQLRHLVLLAGNLRNRQWVKHVHFRGLTFAHTNWSTPPEGQSFPQADVNLGAAVAAMAARNIVVEDCAVRHVGEYAIAFGPGCRHNRVEGCELVDLGAGGVKIGHALPTTWGNTLAPPKDEEDLVSHHTVRNCLIAHGGRLHPAAVGVWIGHSPHNTIQHNDVYDFYYTAFSFGWSWGYHHSHAHHNDLGFNHAHHIGQGVLSDMGCIYTLGVSPGTVIHDNHFHDVVSYDYGGWGLYTDEGSSGIVMKNNLVYRCSKGGFHQHYGKENRIENNILAYGGQHQVQRTRTENHTSFFFERNIVFWDNDSPLLGSNWKDNNFKLDHNTYWHAGKPVVFPGNLTLDQWRDQRGQDVHSMIDDPGFVDPKNDNFQLKPNSPALKTGFKPFDVTQAGRQKPAVLTAELPNRDTVGEATWPWTDWTNPSIPGSLPITVVCQIPCSHESGQSQSAAPEFPPSGLCCGPDGRSPPPLPAPPVS